METISSILVLTGLGLIIYWFINRKKNKPATHSNELKFLFKRYLGFIGLLLLIIGSLISPVSTEEQKSMPDPQKKSDTSSTKTSSSSLSYKKIKVGMTYNDMIKVAGKPDYDGYKNSKYVTYEDKNIYFNKGKVRGGDTKELVDEVKKNGDDKKKQEQEDREILQYRAERFGQKTVESLQRPNSPYQSEKVQEGMIYTTKYNGEMLVRLDTDDGYTHVSEFDKNSETGMGKDLYTGKTILQDSPNYVIQN